MGELRELRSWLAQELRAKRRLRDTYPTDLSMRQMAVVRSEVEALKAIAIRLPGWADRESAMEGLREMLDGVLKRLQEARGQGVRFVEYLLGQERGLEAALAAVRER